MGRLVLLIILGLVLYTVLHLLIKELSPGKRNARREAELEELVQDPFCQTYIPKQSALHRKILGKDCYFCSKKCLTDYLERKL